MNWFIEEKEPDVNPFIQKSNEKQLAKAKQLKRQIKNEKHDLIKNGKNGKIIA